MTGVAFTFIPDTDFIERELDTTLRSDSESVDRKLHAMLAAIDDSLAGISDAREELHTLYKLHDVSTVAEILADEIDDQDIATHLVDAVRNLRAAAAILRSHQ